MPLKFQKLGRSSQAVVATPNDLADVCALPDGLWVATAATIDTLRLDKVFLSLVDADADGRIRSDDVRASIKWLFALLKDTSAVKGGVTTLALHSLVEGGDGALVRDAARRMLTSEGKPDGTEISLTTVRAVRAAEEARGLSSAGKVLPAAAGADAALKGFLEHVVEVTGGVLHPAGGNAVSADLLDAYLAQGKEWLAWVDRVVVDVSEALAAHTAVAAKLEQYFLLSDAIALDADLAKRAWIETTGTDLLDAAVATALLERAPLARPRADGVLDARSGLNPAWRGRVQAWASAVGGLGLDAARIDRALVAAVAGKLEAYSAWLAKKPSTKAGDRGNDALRAHLEDASLASRTRDLLVKADAAALALDGVKLVEKAILYQAWLLPLANSMVTLPDLFDTKARCWMEHGTLVIDGRVFDLALKVNDVARAERFAAMSPLYTMFVRVGEKGGTLDHEYMVPVTAGERMHLVDGMWGVFFDVEGLEHHAQIRKMVANPISISEALWSPFRKIGESIQTALDKASASQTGAMSTSVTAKATAAADTAAAAPTHVLAAGSPPVVPAAPPVPAVPAAPVPAAPLAPMAALPAPHPAVPPSPLGGLPVLLAGGGIALGAIGAFVTGALAQLFSATATVSAGIGDLAKSSLQAVAAASGPGETGVIANMTDASTTVIAAVSYPFALLLVIAGIVLVPFLIYAVPVSLATWFRLRRRDLATLLEASGWAINTRLYLDRNLAVRLTRYPTY